MTRAAAMIVVMAAGPGGDSLQGPEVLEHGIGPLGRGPHGGQQVVAGLLVRCRAGVLRGCQHADPGPLIPLVGQDRHPQPCGPVQGGQHMESGRGQVVGGAGLHRARVHGEPGVIHHHLHVAPERLPLARIPQVAARVRVAPGPPGRCGSGSRPGRRSAPSIGAAGPGPREGPGPGRRSPPGPHADTGRRWPGSPSSRGPVWSGRCPPPSTSAGAPPEPGRWPPSARASRRAPCGGPPTTGRWRGRWTREHRQWQDKTARGDPLVVIHVVRTHYPGPVPARTTPWSAWRSSDWIVLGFVEGWLCRGGCRGGGGGVVAMVAVLGGGG